MLIDDDVLLADNCLALAANLEQAAKPLEELDSVVAKELLARVPVQGLVLMLVRVADVLEALDKSSVAPGGGESDTWAAWLESLKPMMAATQEALAKCERGEVARGALAIAEYACLAQAARDELADAADELFPGAFGVEAPPDPGYSPERVREIAEAVRAMAGEWRLAFDALRPVGDPEAVDLLEIEPEVLGSMKVLSNELERAASHGSEAKTRTAWIGAEVHLVDVVDLMEQLAPPRLDWKLFPDSPELAACCAAILEGADRLAAFAEECCPELSRLPFPALATLRERECGPPEADLLEAVRNELGYPRRAIPLNIFLDELDSVRAFMASRP